MEIHKRNQSKSIDPYNYKTLDDSIPSKSLLGTLETRKKYKEKSQVIKYISRNESNPKLFEDYKKDLKLIMKGYNLEAKKKEKDKTLGPNSEDSKGIKQYMKKFNRNNSSMIEGVKVIVDVDHEEYTDPLESLNILKNNRLIFERINNSNTDRRLVIYKRMIEEVENRSVFDSKRIKVTNIIPKKGLNSINQNKNDSGRLFY